MSRELFFLMIFGLLSLQMVLSLVQVKRYKKELDGLRGTGTVGIGHTKGGMKLGQILIVSYSKKRDCVVACRQMRGITIFAKFKALTDIQGMSLAALKEEALRQDAEEFKRRRKKHPYDKEAIVSKKKGALIQAVEAIEKRLASEERQAVIRTQISRHHAGGLSAKETV